MDKQQAYQSVRHQLRQWEQALAAVDEVHAKYGVAGKPAPDIQTLQSGPPVGAEGVEEIRRVENPPSASGKNSKRPWSAGTAWC